MGETKHMQTVVYQGTFDPFTQGHLAVVKSARQLFDRVVVLLLVNPGKKPLFSVQDRQKKKKKTLELAQIDGVSVDHSDGLLADYMQKHGLSVCVRGIRNGRDCEFELENHRLSRHFFAGLQTVFLPCDPQLADISSSAVKAACGYGKLPKTWVPQNVADELKKKYPNLKFI